MFLLAVTGKCQQTDKDHDDKNDIETDIETDIARV